jgi:hypothetical protein
MHEKSVSVGHSRRDILQFAAASAAGLALPDGLSADSGLLRSAGVLTFGPDSVLFVGDITGAKIHAFALRDGDLTSQADVISGNLLSCSDEAARHIAAVCPAIEIGIAKKSVSSRESSKPFILFSAETRYQLGLFFPWRLGDLSGESLPISGT